MPDTSNGGLTEAAPGVPNYPLARSAACPLGCAAVPDAHPAERFDGVERHDFRRRGWGDYFVTPLSSPSLDMHRFNHGGRYEYVRCRVTFRAIQPPSGQPPCTRV